ncbi:L-aspartate oxidase [Deinococcus maricopensis]|uniref:L-aspartate oxidase n=1 Tax=Deinococcus maricopensis TaxID=309887 RepID=UPI00247853F3|nr:FAD-binding protein [Deinococcus maricopensis]
MKVDARTDVLIIGGGVAGLYAALRARALGLHVTLACKGALTGGSTYWAQGGVAAPLGPWDEAAHARDTLAAGRGLCEPRVVDVFVREAQAHVDAVRALGVPFAEDLAREGGHGLARVRHAFGDGTGRAVSEVLAARAHAAGVEVLEGAFARALLLGASGRVVGAEFLVGGGVRAVQAGGVLLATGGFGRVYPVTTAPPEGTGDGVALAARAGAQVRDVEFVQFHPTVVVSGGEGLLVTEAARGAGGVLRNAFGERFMLAYDAAGELAPRDVVARAIARERARTGDVTLDVSHLGEAAVRARFPGVHARLLREGLDVSRVPVPVQPAVHYTMGGVRTDVRAFTGVPGLFAAGEVASSGLHGANRLASNSLSEGLVFGARAVAAMAGDVTFEVPARRTDAPGLGAEGAARVRALVAAHAGLERSGEALRGALAALPAVEGEAGDRAAAEGGNLLEVARFLLRGALAREESRGAHVRLEFPAADGVARHVVQGTARVWAEPVEGLASAVE